MNAPLLSPKDFEFPAIALSGIVDHGMYLHFKNCLGSAPQQGLVVVEISTLGGDPETSTSMSADMHRRWVDLKAMITGKDDEAILNECERGEDVAVKSYRKALEKDLPAEVRSVVQNQYQGVQRNHDQVKALRDAARARG